MENHTFSDRTDKLALSLGISLNDLPERMGISRAMFFAYRSGRNPITRKALAKLEKAEAESGLNPVYIRDPEFFASPLKSAAEIADEASVKLGLGESVKRQLFSIAAKILTNEMTARLPRMSQAQEHADAADRKLVEVQERLEEVQRTLNEILAVNPTSKTSRKKKD